MAPRITCPECGSDLDIGLHSGGDQINCAKCGALLEIPAFVKPVANTETGGDEVPAWLSESNQIRVNQLGFNWGAFFLTPIWLMAHKMIGWGFLIILINLATRILGVLGFFIMIPISIYVGINGYKYAWKRKKYNSVEDMLQKQKVWGIAGGVLAGSFALLILIVALTV